VPSRSEPSSRFAPNTGPSRMRASSRRSWDPGPSPRPCGSVWSSRRRTAPLLRRRARRQDRRSAMVIRITWGKLRAGAWNDFERTYKETVLTKGKKLKGLRGRWLAQDEADKDTGFAMSLRDNTADMQAYEQSALYREIMTPLQPFFVGEYKTYRCDVKYTDVGA